MRPHLRVVALLSGVVAALLLVELLLRLDPAVPVVAARAGPVDLTDVRLGWTSDAYDRVPPLDPAPDGRFRLLALGDSYLTAAPRYSRGGRDMLWPVHLGRLLPPELRAHYRARTLAAPGWGPNQQLVAHEHKGRSFEPDLVVLCLCSNNDLLDITTSTDANRARRPYFQLVDGRLVGSDARGRPIRWELDRPGGVSGEPWEAQGAEPWSVGRSRLLDLLRGRVGEGGSSARADLDRRYAAWSGLPSARSLAALEFPDRLGHAPQSEHDLLNAYIVGPSEWLDYQWALLRALLGVLRDRVELDGGELAVLVLPMTLDPDDPELLSGSGFTHRFETPEGPIVVDLAHPTRRVEALCGELGIECWSVIDAFHARATEPGVFEQVFPDDNRHWTWAGHAILAELLVDRVAARVRAHRRERRRRTSTART